MRITKTALSALATGAIAGGSAALLLTPAIGSAQESDPAPVEETAPAEADEDADSKEGCFGLRGGHRGAGLETAADTIGIETDALLDAFRDGQTIAEVAEANQVDPQAVIDAMVVEAQARFDEAVADGKIDPENLPEDAPSIEERVTDLVNGELPERPFGRHGHRGGPGGFQRGPFDAQPNGDDSTDEAVFEAFLS